MRIGSYSYDNALHRSRKHCVEEFGEIATGFLAGLRKALRSTAGSPVVQPIRRESGSTSLLTNTLDASYWRRQPAYCTTCTNAAEMCGLNVMSPEYLACIRWLPTLKVEVVTDA